MRGMTHRDQLERMKARRQQREERARRVRVRECLIEPSAECDAEHADEEAARRHDAKHVAQPPRMQPSTKDDSCHGVDRAKQRMRLPLPEPRLEAGGKMHPDLQGGMADDRRDRQLADRAMDDYGSIV